MSLPIVLSQSRDITTLQTLWAQQLNPLIAAPLSNGLLLKGVQLLAGTNVVNHTLGRNLIGWHITRMRNTAVTVFDTQDANPRQNLTLQLTSSGPCLVDLFVF